MSTARVMTMPDLRAPRLPGGPPRLGLYFGTGGHRVVLAPPGAGSPVAPLADIRTRHPILACPSSSTAEARSASRPSGESMPPLLSADLIEHYNEELRRFYAAYRGYLAQLAEWERNAALTGSLSLKLVNSGTMPVTLVNVRLEFPPAPILLEADPLAVRPRSPPPPQLLPCFDPPGRETAVYRAPPAPAAAEWSRTIDSPAGQAAFSLAALPDGSVRDLPRLFFRFPAANAVGPFSIAYRLLAAELDDPTEGRLDIAVD